MPTPEPVSVAAPVTCTTCSRIRGTNCACLQCNACAGFRETEDVCTNCHLCTYNGCCECWSCTQCHNMFTATTRSCNYCSRCPSCCHCVECPDCHNRQDRALCSECNVCNNCCGCGDGGHIRFFRGPTPPMFHAAGKGELKINPSRRFISAEIEVANCTGTTDTTSKVVRSWKGSIVEDGSLPGTGFEINTAPAAGDLFVKQINEICEGLKKHKAVVTEQCGLHVHVDARDFTFYDIRKLAFLYQKVEPAFFGLIAPSRKTSRFCQPCGEKFVRDLEKQIIPKDNEKTLIKNIYGDPNTNIQYLRGEKYNGARYSALNVHSWIFRGTIENRMHHGTIKADKIINWGMLNASMLDYAFQNTEKDIKALKGDPLSILLSICPTESLKEWVITRHKFFKEREERNERGTGEEF